jgi:hypothetical protein
MGPSGNVKLKIIFNIVIINPDGLMGNCLSHTRM